MLKEYFEDIDKNYNHTDPIKFILCLDKNITNMDYMFYKCDTLISFVEIQQEYEAVEQLNEINFQCNSINDNNDFYNIFNFEEDEYLPSIKNSTSSNFIRTNENIINSFPKSSLKFNELKEINYMFAGCISLISYLIYQNGILLI